MVDKLSHIGNDNKPAMVDVTSKPDLYRIARASGFIHLEENTLRLISENSMKKGNVLITAELAGVMGAKKTPDLIPLCHSLNTTKINVKANMEINGVSVVSEVICVGKTGVEMEALTAVSVALLTVYDMCKAVDKNMRITDVTLLEKQKKTIN
ncbi:MAG: cyclic pyranopterin monophosphate synthase MoaC [bacterium]|nr:cyclic pyranopterin monophosphate synthase MoaC [bacterium]